jgi:hypothetical protein
MANDDLLELFRQHRESQDKYAYFMIAVAGSAIAFAIQKSESAEMTWPLLPLGLAILSFALSFCCGLKRLEWTSAALRANLAWLQLRRGTYPGQPPPGESTEAAISGTWSALEKNSEKAHVNSRWQMRWLFSGVVLFVIWHALDIYLFTF